MEAHRLHISKAFRFLVIPVVLLLLMACQGLDHPALSVTDAQGSGGAPTGSATAKQANRAIPTPDARTAEPTLACCGNGQTNAITPTLALMVDLPITLRNSRDCHQLTGLEADYIRACQEDDPSDLAYGAINDVWGDPTWVVPSEVAMATLGLDLASVSLDDPSYRDSALLALDYLIRVQQPDGWWYNQYSHTVPYGDTSKSAHQTAEVMIALYRLAYYPDGYNAITRSAQSLLDFQKGAMILGFVERRVICIVWH
jgi:hypothetical protein